MKPSRHATSSIQPIFETLALFDNLNKLPSGSERIDRSGIEPNGSAVEYRDAERPGLQVVIIDGGDFEFAAGAWRDGFRYLDNRVVVEVEAGDCVVALGVCWLLLDRGGLASESNSTTP